MKVDYCCSFCLCVKILEKKKKSVLNFYYKKKPQKLFDVPFNHHSHLRRVSGGLTVQNKIQISKTIKYYTIKYMFEK